MDTDKTEEIIERYWSAIVATTDQTRDILSDDAFLLALRLVVQEAYAAGKRDSEHTEQETEHGTR